MGDSSELSFVPYGRPISLRIHPALLVRLDQEVDRLNRTRLPRPVTRSSLIQQAVRLFLDGPTRRTEEEAQATPVPGIAEPRRYRARADGAVQATESRARKDRGHMLWRRFEQACDAEQVTPPQWLRSAAHLDRHLDRATLLAWYRVGELPEGDDGDRLLGLVETWLDERS
jgi:hypothetical protein